MAKKKPTDAELKEQLWQMAAQVDWENESISEIENLNEYDDWDVKMKERPQKKIKISFECLPSDLNKIIDEVDGTCLSDLLKESVAAAIGASK